MNVLAFVTDDGAEASTGPILFVKDFATASIPVHPRGLAWKYFATVTEDDELLGENRKVIKLALQRHEPFVAPPRR